MKVVSWNINNVGCAFFTTIKDLIIGNKIDMILFQECDLKDKDMKTLGFFKIGKGQQNLKLYCKIGLKKQIKKIDTKKIQIADDINRAIIFSYETNGKTILFVALHFPSKLQRNDMDQYKLATEWKRTIQEYRKVYSASEIILFGDFNLNPFDFGMNDSDSFHGLPIKGRFKSYLINPMWTFFGGTVYGSTTIKPPGTYKFNSRKSGENLWNVFDGVLFTKGLLDLGLIDLSTIRIVDKTNKEPLYTHNKIIYSDHLPIEFIIN